MSDDTTPSPRRLPESWTVAQVVGGAALLVTVAILVVGAFLVGRPASAFEDAGEHIAAFYEESDVEGMLRAFPAGSLPEEQAAATENALGQLLVPGVGVSDVAEPVDVAGVPIVRVTTADGLDWCVRPDGGVLPRCRVGVVDIETRTDSGIVTEVGLVEIPIEGPPQLTLGLTTGGSEPIVLEGFELQTPDGDEPGADLVQGVVVQGGQGFPADLQAPEVLPGTTLFLIYAVDEDPSDRDLTLVWEGGELELDLSRTRYFVR